MSKMYPFSTVKHAHSIEFFYNRIKNTIDDVRNGELSMNSARFDKMCSFFDGELHDLYLAMFDGNGRVTYLTGKQLGLAKRIVAWASEQRAASLISNGKFEYLKYC